MEINKLKSNKDSILKGPAILIPKKISDSRGYFYESWNNKEFNKNIGEEIIFVQDNHSKSSLGVLRGLHFQKRPKAQGKLVRVLKGEIYDVIVDLRLKSKTFGEWGIVKLSHRNRKQLWIPIGFGHGFLTKTKSAEVLYKTTNYWDKDSERTLNWQDSQLNINWQLRNLNITNPILSVKDSEGTSLTQLIKNRDLF